ncbi:MAG: hypothetical protein IKA32_12670, partial [Lentisphaeria bacterium]|nr:hypothetical protein [Lentisphaeria bacterium]
AKPVEEQPAAPVEETQKTEPQAAPPAVEIPQSEVPETPVEAAPVETPAETPAEAPAETPVETPAPKDDEITLAPETRKRKKKAENENGENAEAGEGENPEEGKKKTRRQKEPSEKKALPKSVKIIIHLLIVLLILGGAAGGFYFAAKKDKLPAKFKPWGEKALSWIGQKPDAPATAPADDQTEKKQEPEKPKEPEKPQTRPEYLATLEKLQGEFRNTAPRQREKLLIKADEIFRKIGPHQTPEELNELIRTWALYSTADENLRFQSAREAARAKYEKAAEARRAALEKEAARLQKQKEEDARREQALKQQNAEFDREQKKRLAEIKIRFTKLKAELDTLNLKLAKALINSAESGDDTAFENALQEAKNHVVPTVCDTIAERAEIKIFETIKRLAPSAFSAYKTFISDSKKITARGLLMIPVNGTNTLVRLTGITSDGKIAYRTTKGENGLYMPNSAKARRSIENYLLKNTSLTGGAFYYNLLTRYFDPVVVKYCPNQFWVLLFKQYRHLASQIKQ